MFGFVPTLILLDWESIVPRAVSHAEQLKIATTSPVFCKQKLVLLLKTDGRITLTIQKNFRK